MDSVVSNESLPGWQCAEKAPTQQHNRSFRSQCIIITLYQNKHFTDISVLLVSICFIEQCLTVEKYTLDYCAGDWTHMTDQNYAQLVDRFKHCLNISKQLNGEERRQFKSKMGENFANICRQFLDRTELPPKDLIKTARNIIRSVAPYLDEDVFYNAGCTSCTSTTTQSTRPTNMLVQPTDHPATNNLSMKMTNRTIGENKYRAVSTRNVLSTRGPDLIEISLCDSTPAPKPPKDNTLLYEILILLGFLALILVQLILLLCLLCKCALFCRLRENQCAVETMCPNEIQISRVCEEILERNPQTYTVHQHREVRSQSEATPSTSAEMAAGKLKRKMNKISTELSSLSSSDLGSDSEFEALMRRRPLLEKKKRAT